MQEQQVHPARPAIAAICSRALLVWGFVLQGPPAAYAQTVTPELKLMAASCAACHGFEGRATGVGMPLAGQTAEILSAKLLAFKSGQVSSTVMQQHTKGYADEELKSLAEYFSKIK